MPEDKPEIEKSEVRVIELNEWFTPFQLYEDIPYKEAVQTYRLKTIIVKVANVGDIELRLSWDQEMLEEHRDDPIPSIKYLLVLPNSEKFINDEGKMEEQKKLESRLFTLDLDAIDPKWLEKDVPITVEVKLPSGNLISAPFKGDPLNLNPPTVMDHWLDEKTQEYFFTPLIPEVENILGKIQMRFVPKN